MFVCLSWKDDATAPVITLLGLDTVELKVGDIYTTDEDDGAIATDDTDGDISKNVHTTGLPVDTEIPFTYTITYDVFNSVGNVYIYIYI